MIANVTTYGGDERPIPRSAKTWQLNVNGRFIADSTFTIDRDLYEEIAAVLNREMLDAARASFLRALEPTDRLNEKWVRA